MLSVKSKYDTMLTKPHGIREGTFHLSDISISLEHTGGSVVVSYTPSEQSLVTYGEDPGQDFRFLSRPEPDPEQSVFLESGSREFKKCERKRRI